MTQLIAIPSVAPPDDVTILLECGHDYIVPASIVGKASHARVHCPNCLTDNPWRGRMRDALAIIPHRAGLRLK